MMNALELPPGKANKPVTTQPFAHFQSLEVCENADPVKIVPHQQHFIVGKCRIIATEQNIIYNNIKPFCRHRFHGPTHAAKYLCPTRPARNDDFGKSVALDLLVGKSVWMIGITVR